MQRHRAIAYVMAGSARSLIEQMIASKDRAFWKLADTMHFAPIDPTIMADWITTRADDTGVPFDPAGLALATASTKARMFWASCASPNEALPTEP